MERILADQQALFLYVIREGMILRRIDMGEASPNTAMVVPPAFKAASWQILSMPRARPLTIV